MSELPTLDLLGVVKKSLGKRVRLDNLAQATLGQGKIGDGFQAINYFQKGDWESLEKYCLQDVKITRDFYDFGKKNGVWRYLKPPDQIIEFKIIWPQIDEDPGGVNLSLGI